MQTKLLQQKEKYEILENKLKAAEDGAEIYKNDSQNLKNLREEHAKLKVGQNSDNVFFLCSIFTSLT